MKKLISVILAAAVMLSVMGVTAFAYSDRAKRVSVRLPSTGNRSLRVGRTVQLEARIYPDDLYYDDMEWDSSDYNIADVNSYGEVYGVTPGEVTIYCRLYTYEYADVYGRRPKKVRVGSGSINLVVADRYGNAPSSSSSVPPNPEPLTPSVTVSNEKIPTSAVVEAVKSSVVKGKTTSVTFTGVGRVSAETIKAANEAMKAGGGVVLLNFDTLDSSSKKVGGRVTINPAEAASLNKDILPAIYISGSMVKKMEDKFSSTFPNHFEVVKSMQEESFGMRVKVYARTSPTFKDTKKLRLYSYDHETGIYFEVKNAGIKVNGSYIVFYTTLSEHLVIVEGELKIK